MTNTYLEANKQYSDDWLLVKEKIENPKISKIEARVAFIQFCQKHDSRMELSETNNLKTLMAENKGLSYAPDQLEKIRQNI